MKAALLLVLWQVHTACGGGNFFQPYYNREFVSFVEQINSKSHKRFIWEIFRNLKYFNSTNQCLRDLKHYQDGIVRNEMWATEFLDSSGISNTGWLSGNTISLGDYKQCLSPLPRNLSSAYCLLTIKLTKNEIQSSLWIPSNMPIAFSLCIPNTCEAKQLEQLLEPTTSKRNMSIKVECQTERPGFTFGDVIVMIFFFLTWVLILTTTIPKKWIPVNHTSWLTLWESFNLKNNLSNLLKTNGRTHLLSSLHGLRVLSQCFIVWYHIVLSQTMENNPVLNKFSFNKFFRSWRGAIEMELVLAVDTFFLIGGILLTWNCMEKRKNLNLIEYYSHRLLRLMPPYLATILIVSTFGNKLCDGPLCHYIIDKEKSSCESYWWTNLLFINNFYPGILKSCMPHSWYLAADWQLFFVLSPIVVVVINKWPQYLFKLLTAIFITSFTSSFMVSYFYQLPTDGLMYSNYTEAEKYYNKLYATPYVRAGPWVIGMFFGAFFHNYKNKPANISKNLRLLAWLFTIVGLTLSIELDLPFLRHKQTTERGVWSSLFNASQRNIWAISVGWIVFSSGTRKAGPIGNLLCWSAFQPLAKLSYSAYLIHKLIISLYFGETNGYTYISATTQIPLILGITFLSYIAALLLYISFEAPIAHLEKVIFKKGATNSATPSIGDRGMNKLTQESNNGRNDDLNLRQVDHQS